MIREIRRKQVILNNRRPFDSHVQNNIDYMDRVDWIYANLVLEGSSMSRENIQSILAGEVVPKGTIADHMLINSLEEIRKLMKTFADMKLEFDFQVLRKFNECLCGEENLSYRRNTPVILEYAYTPPIAAEIPALMKQFEGKLFSMNPPENEIRKAVKIHNGLLEIYPFTEGNQLLARTAMSYHLISCGLPGVIPEMAESEYNRDFEQYLKTGSDEALYKKLTQAVYNRLELMIQLTAY